RSASRSWSSGLHSSRAGGVASPRCRFRRRPGISRRSSAPAASGGRCSWVSEHSSFSRSTSIPAAWPRSRSTGPGAPTRASPAARSSSMVAPAERLVPPEHGIAYPNVTVGAALDGDLELAADAVVVGTGAGGATAAARLRDAGLDVLMLEEGALHRTETFVTDPATMIQRLYRDAGTTMILGRPPILFAEGRCVGGSTVINGGVSWRTPEPVLEHWERDLRRPDHAAPAVEPYCAAAERILHVEPNAEDTFGRNTTLFLEGARRLGWPAARALRNMRRCVGLNNCALGCPTGAKQAMHVTEVPRALSAGATL